MILDASRPSSCRCLCAGMPFAPPPLPAPVLPAIPGRFDGSGQGRRKGRLDARPWNQPCHLAAPGGPAGAAAFLRPAIPATQPKVCLPARDGSGRSPSPRRRWELDAGGRGVGRLPRTAWRGKGGTRRACSDSTASPQPSGTECRRGALLRLRD